jgi:hypothetical protein
MNRRAVTASAIVATCTFIVTLAIAAAQDRLSVKVPNGLALSEFKGYDAW